MTTAEKLQKIAENEQKVYAAGEKAEYDRLWDNLLQSDKSGRNVMFCGWTDEIFKPKYDVSVAYGAFQNSEITDLRPETVGVDIDFSKLTDFNYMLRGSKIKYIGVVDMSNADYGWCLFSSANELEYVEKLILPIEYNSSLVFKNNGFACKKLTHIVFENYFYADVQFNSCTNLTRDSLLSIINALYDYSSDPNDYPDRNIVLTLGSVNLAKLTDEELDLIYSKGWECK